MMLDALCGLWNGIVYVGLFVVLGLMNGLGPLS
jgi:hypothetical protein